MKWFLVPLVGWIVLSALLWPWLDVWAVVIPYWIACLAMGCFGGAMAARSFR